MQDAFHLGYMEPLLEMAAPLLGPEHAKLESRKACQCQGCSEARQFRPAKPDGNRDTALSRRAGCIVALAKSDPPRAVGNSR